MNALHDAILAAFNAGYKQALSGDDRLSEDDRTDHRDKSNEFLTCAWMRLATLPGDVGDAARAELARMKLEIRQTSDRNGKLYQVMHHGQIVGEADDESTVERVKDIIAAAYAAHGDDAFIAGSSGNEAAKKALLNAGLENVARIC